MNPKSDEQLFSDLLSLIRQKKVGIEVYQFGSKSFLKSLWFKFASIYVRFRAVRDYDFFHSAYTASIICLRAGDVLVSAPNNWTDVFNAVRQDS